MPFKSQVCPLRKLSSKSNTALIFVKSQASNVYTGSHEKEFDVKKSCEVMHVPFHDIAVKSGAYVSTRMKLLFQVLCFST